MKSQYTYVNRMTELYNMLGDQLSKDIFWARLAYDVEQSPNNLMRLARLGEQQQWLDALMDRVPDFVRTVERRQKKLVLYGTRATGQVIATIFLEQNILFYGFCGRGAKRFSDGLMGKPVISPDYLFQHADDFCVIVSAGESHDEIMNILKDHHFPQDQILSYKPANAIDHQYFEFPTLFRHGTAFVDGGSLDCHIAFLFSDWCKGEYSKIFAYEPDPTSYSICEQRIAESKTRDIQLIRAGLSDHNGEVMFQANLYMGSHIIDDDAAADENTVTIQVTTIDNTVGDEKIGFIKMDIEGAEFDALHGAKKVIVRDKPLLAISVYHRIGDMLAIMDYLHQLVPEYCFWLRHYSIGNADTVLYASIDVLDENGEYEAAL